MIRRLSKRQEKGLANIYNNVRADFRAGKDSRFGSRLRGVSSAGSGMDYHYRSEPEFLHMIERARHYQRNDQIVGQGIRRLTANIVQDGFRLDPETGNEEANKGLLNRWEHWCSDPDMCHSEGELTFHQQEQLVFSTHIVDGDELVLPRREGFLQHIEAHRLRTPRNTRRNVVHGILLDDDARRQEYWVTREDLDPYKPLSRVSDIKAYPARDEDGHRQVFHIYNPYRLSQRRGVSYVAPISDTVGIHDDLQFATLVKSQIASLIGLIRERNGEWRAPEDDDDDAIGPRREESLDGVIRTIEGLAAGLEVFSSPGEKITAFTPNIPGEQFVPHAMLILTFIAVNLEMPVQMLLLDPSNTNFSGWRGAVDQARLRFRQLQKWLWQKFHAPVYRWKVRQWIESDKEVRRWANELGDSIFMHKWYPPQFPYIEPLKDTSTDLLQARNGINSHRRIQAARGRDWDTVSTEIVDDNGLAIKKAIEKANEINGEFPEADVHWRELISLPTPDGVTVSLSAGASDASLPADQNTPPNQQPNQN